MDFIEYLYWCLELKQNDPAAYELHIRVVGLGY
jgi:hypothetical protein